MTIKTLKKSLITGVATATVGLAIATPAQADMFAYAKLALSNFQILGSDGQIIDNSEDLVGLTYTSSADMDGALTGTAGFVNDEPNSQGDIEFASSCLSTTGDCNPLTENAFPFLTGPQGTDYVAADQTQTGSPVEGIGSLTTPAEISAIAVGSLANTQAEGTANVNNGLEANWQFSLAQDQGITFSGDVATYLEAFASAGEIAPGKASASTTFEITITDLTTGQIVFDIGNAADLLNQTTSVNANGFPVDITTCGDFASLGGCGNEFNTSFAVTTDPLQANTLYQLSARTNVNIDIARVSEPGVLALMGLGFLSIFAAGRRRAARA